MNRIKEKVCEKLIAKAPDFGQGSCWVFIGEPAISDNLKRIIMEKIEKKEK